MLVLNHLQKRFGDKLALDNISLRLAAGEVLALLGPSGCGKSTLLNLVAGLLIPDAGQVWFDGCDITTLPPERRRFALMFQDFALFPHLNVLGNVCFGLQEQGLSQAQAQNLAQPMLERLRLSGYAQRKVTTLSGGEQQRVALARALVTQPRLLLLDEPFSSLDAQLRTQLQSEFKSLLAELDMAVMWVTHDREEAFAMAQHIAVLKAGQLVQHASPAALLAAPATPWLARFIGYQNVSEQAVTPEQALLLGPAYPPAKILQLNHSHEALRLTVQLASETYQLSLSAREARQYAGLLHEGGAIGVKVDEAAVWRFEASR